MENMKRAFLRPAVRCWYVAFVVLLTVGTAFSGDLPEIKQNGVLRHLGVPYANFVTGSGDGLEVELLKLFARDLGVDYQYVETTWQDVIPDLTGKRIKPNGNEIVELGSCPVRGDLIANGLTILPWREKAIAYSTPTFPTQVWLVTRADSPLVPIKPTGEIQKDIAAVKALLKDRTLLGKASTCLDPSLYGLQEFGAQIKLFNGKLNELAPALIYHEAESTLLDVPDALIALEKWSGQIKIIGPISPMQQMGYGFSKTAPRLRETFNDFFERCKQDGTYEHLIRKYYPAVFKYYPEFFK